MKIIAFANQKGGCGKSSLALILANFLVRNKNKTVQIIDADKQQSLSNLYQLEVSKFNSAPSIKVTGVNVKDLIEKLNDDSIYKDSIDYLIIDMANQINQENFSILEYVHHIIVPYNLSQSSIASTMFFNDVYRQYFKEDAKLIYIANAIKTRGNKNNIKEFKEYLDQNTDNSMLVDQIVKDTIEIQKINTITLKDPLLEELHNVLEELTIKLNIT